jgi:O-antigen/teichoic acid export membrane protein
LNNVKHTGGRWWTRLRRNIVAGATPFHAALLTICTQGFVLVVNFITSVITARLLGPQGRGIFAAVTIWPTFLGGFALLGIPSAAIYYMGSQSEGRREIVGATYILASLTCALSMVAGSILAPLTMPAGSRGTLVVLEFCIFCTWNYVAAEILRAVLVACGCFRAFSKSIYMSPLLYLIGLGATALTIGISPLIAIMCLMLGGVLGTLWTLREANRIIRPRFRGSRPWLKRIVLYAAKLAPGAVSFNLMGSIDRLILIPYLTTAELGLYAVAYNLSRLVLVLQMAIRRVLYPKMAGRTRAEIQETHDLAFRLVFYAAALGVIILSAMAYQLVTVIYGPTYAKAASLLAVLAVEAGLSCAGEVTNQLFFSLNQPGLPSIVQVVTLALAATLLFVLVPSYGAIGAAYGLAAAGLVRLVVLLVSMTVYLKMPLPRLLPRMSDARHLRAQLL